MWIAFVVDPQKAILVGEVLEHHYRNCVMPSGWFGLFHWNEILTRITLGTVMRTPPELNLSN
jgi:hypothetical protein